VASLDPDPFGQRRTGRERPRWRTDAGRPSPALTLPRSLIIVAVWVGLLVFSIVTGEGSPG